MKNLILILITSLLAFANSQSVQATEPKDPAKIKLDLQSKVQQIVELHQSLKVNKVLQSIQENFTAIYNEERTGHVESRTARQQLESINLVHASSAWARFDFSSRGIHYAASSKVFDINLPVVVRTETYDSYDQTRLVLQNSGEQAAFEKKVQSDKTQLNQMIHQYFADHTDQIIALKLLGAEALRLITVLVQEGSSVDPEILQTIISGVHFVQFFSEQNVTSCVQTHTLAKTSVHSEITTMSSLLFQTTAVNANETVTTPASSETNCNSSLNSLVVSDREPVYKIKMQKLDQIVDSWILAAGTAMEFDFEQVRLPPQFNLTYFH